MHGLVKGTFDFGKYPWGTKFDGISITHWLLSFPLMRLTFIERWVVFIKFAHSVSLTMMFTSGI